MSLTFSTKSGSVESLKLSLRHGCSPKAFQIRPSLQMRVEEGHDPPPRVLGGGLVIADSHDDQHSEQKVAVVVEERVPGVGILLDVVVDSVCS